MSKTYKLPLLIEPQPDGGYTVTSPLVPELITEAMDLTEILPNVSDALLAVIELYQDLGKPLPSILQPIAMDSAMWADALVTAE